MATVREDLWYESSIGGHLPLSSVSLHLRRHSGVSISSLTSLCRVLLMLKPRLNDNAHIHLWAECYLIITNHLLLPWP